MIELVMTVCLLKHQQLCKDISLTYASDVTPMQCMVGSTPQIAKWAEMNPKWFIKRWGCRKAGTFAKV